MEFWCSSLVEETVFFQLLWLEGGAYLWIGSGDHRLDSLAVGVPASAGARGRAATPSATTLLGGHEGDAGSQRLAQRLSSKVGRPIFVSLNLRDDPQLRLFAEREAVAALTARVAASSTTSANGAAGLERLSSLALDAAPLQAVPAAPAAPAPASAPVSSSPAAGVAGGAGDGTGRGARTREVFASPDEIATRAVALLLEAAAAAIAERGVFVVALSGGSIPALLAPELLAAAPRDQLSRWRVFLADERHVAASHPDSTFGEWRRRFLEPAGMGSEQAVGVAADLPLPQAAELYEEQLLATLRGAAVAAGGGGAAAASPSEFAPPLRLDAVLLGMGPDGHTASLFPAHAVLGETGRAVTYVDDSPKPPACRVTLTLPAINAARLALFVVTGGSKATAVRAAFAAQPDEPVPAGLVLAAGRTHWCLDELAAAQLREAEAAAERLYG